MILYHNETTFSAESRRSHKRWTLLRGAVGRRWRRRHRCSRSRKAGGGWSSLWIDRQRERAGVGGRERDASTLGRPRATSRVSADWWWPPRAARRAPRTSAESSTLRETKLVRTRSARPRPPAFLCVSGPVACFAPRTTLLFLLASR